MKKKNILIIAILINILVFSGLSILRNDNFRLVNGGDVADLNQIFWFTTQGYFFQGTCHSYLFFTKGIHNSFAIHFKPFNILLMPIYTLFPCVNMLMLIKSTFLALAAIPLYLLARDKLKETPALILSLAYLLSPPIALQMFYTIQGETYAPFFLAFMFYFFEKKRFNLFILSAILLILIKESMTLYIFMFGIYALIKKRPLKWSIPLLICSVVYAVSIIYFIMPALGDAIVHTTYKTRVLSLGSINGLLQVANTIFTNFGSFIRCLIPFGFLPIFSPIILFIIPEMLLKIGIVGRELGINHYAVIINMFFFVSLVYLFRSLKTKPLTYLCVALFISMGWRSAGCLNPYYYKRRPYYQTQKEVIKFIPSDASVSAPNYLLPHLSNRFKLDHIGLGEHSDTYRGYDYIIIDLNQETPWEARRNKELVKILPQTYELVFDKDNIRIYKK